MVLMRVDFPQPFGPRMATCSPELIRRLKLSRATLSPRMTCTFCKSTRAGSMGSPKPSIITKFSPSHTQELAQYRINFTDGEGADFVAPAYCRQILIFVAFTGKPPARCRRHNCRFRQEAGHEGGNDSDPRVK